MTTAAPPAAGHPTRPGNPVYWDAAGASLPGHPGCVLACVSPHGVELAHDDPAAGFFARALLYVPAGGARPVPGWPGWRVHCAATDVRPEWWRTTADLYLSYDGPPREPAARPAERCPF